MLFTTLCDILCDTGVTNSTFSVDDAILKRVETNNVNLISLEQSRYR